MKPLVLIGALWQTMLATVILIAALAAVRWLLT
jgi:hypothetical protein